MNVCQRCPTCKNDLEESAYPRCHWGAKGKACRKCQVNRQRIQQLMSNYGLTPDDVVAIIERQHGRCLGCMVELPHNYVIDHDHKTGRVRGVLCRQCNLTLGMVKDDKARLTRLRLYLDRDTTKRNIYIIGSLRNPAITKVSAALRDAGFGVWDEWISAGPEADDHWQRYEQEKGRTFIEALDGFAANNIFLFDKGLIDLADIGVMVMPAGKSGHLELGYMSAQDKKTYILLDKTPDRFDVMPQFADGVVNSVTDLIRVIA